MYLLLFEQAIVLLSANRLSRCEEIFKDFTSVNDLFFCPSRKDCWNLLRKFL